ncbi:hypothetical protein MTR67_007363 [Solanum verrucosum]|uniref:DUF4218 domain-containing protein n=1 Tax=Solanum verrucosum TaxID=315347 RepID=A0AAF0PZN2_SOLVR|nr:hypothetical protein MTR67_007363 [Solanum verrucosum]
MKRADLEGFRAEIKEIDCELEMIFPPTFFDIIEHLPIDHLVDEIKFGGPNHLGYMYAMEKELCEFKDLEYKVEIDSTVRLNAWTRARIHNKKFVNWFKEKVDTVEVPNHLGCLAKDEFVLSRVYFNRLHSMDYHFVLASQVHKVFYVEDPTKTSVYYASNKVHRTQQPMLTLDGQEIEDIPADVVHMPPDAQFLADTSMETSEEYDDNA